MAICFSIKHVVLKPAYKFDVTIKDLPFTTKGCRKPFYTVVKLGENEFSEKEGVT